VRAREADPLDPIDGRTGAQELAELGADVGQQVAAPRVDVLAEQGDLPDAVRGELRDLRENIARPPALLPATNGRDDAVGARRVAPHRDLHPGLVAALPVLRKVSREVLVRAEPTALDAEAAGAEPLTEVRDRARSERHVHERVALEDQLALRLGVAPTDRDHQVWALALAGSRLPEVCGELRIRLLPDGARVEHDDVRRSGVVRLPQPR
jgi:hypothetical protein